MTSELQNLTISEYKFQMTLYDEELSFSDTDTAVVEFAIIPFSHGTTGVWGNSSGSQPFTFFFVSFKGDGTTDVPGVSYDEGVWNDVRVVLDMADQQYTAAVNGQRGDPKPFIGIDDYGEVDDMLASYVGLFDAAGSSGAPSPAWFDSARLTRRSGGSDEVLFAAQFDGPAPAFTATYGSLDFMRPETTEVVEGTCVTIVTVDVAKTDEKIKAEGRLLPRHPGERVTVTLFKKQGGEFVKLQAKRPRLNNKSRYETSFDFPRRTRRCRVTTTFAFDFDHLGDQASKTFGC